MLKPRQRLEPVCERGTSAGQRRLCSCVYVAFGHVPRKLRLDTAAAVRLQATVSARPFVSAPSPVKATIHDDSRKIPHNGSPSLAALPVWNNKQRYSVFPASTPELGQMHARGMLLLVWPPPPPSCCSMQASACMYGITDRGLDVENNMGHKMEFVFQNGISQ